MHRNLGLTIVGIAITAVALGQVKRQFSVEDGPEFKTVKLQIRANSGTCFIKPSHNTEILNVFSNQDTESYSHQFKKVIKDDICELNLSLEESRTDGFGQSISYKVFGSEKSGSGKFWKMYLTDAKPYMLELNYDLGDAHIDLSGLYIKTLKINTGSADVNVGYFSGLENHITMDTFYVKVDLGSMNARSLSLAKAKTVIADVGFGNVMLDFSNGSLITKNVKGSVGAGNLVILLPSDETPVHIKIKDSWLCSVRMPKELKKVSENTFCNDAYTKNQSGTLAFDLDVSMGNIIFKGGN